MAGFKREVNLDPKEIPRMTMDQKQECMMEIDKTKSRTWKFSALFVVGVFAFFMIYSIISAMYTLKTLQLLPSVSPVLLAIPFITVIPALAAHSMNKGAVALSIAAYLAAAVIVILTGELINGWLALPCVIGAGMYYALFLLCDSYTALSKEEGFPDFFDIESGAAMAKEIIERNQKKEAPLNPLTERAINAEKLRLEKESETEEKPE